MTSPTFETGASEAVDRPLQLFESKLTIAAAFLVALMILLFGLGITPVSRTQEARVLETARQMIEGDWAGWLVPILNGEPRLQKPPLAYWMTALSYLVLGVGEWAGRIPTAITGWLTLLVTYAIARRAYDYRVGLAAASASLGSHLFFRHMRLAETDAPATLFVSIAIGLLWYTATDPRPRWFHLVGVSTAMAVLAKGAPAAFVLVFIIAFCTIEHRWDLMVRFIRSGAPITLLAVALPWFVYVYLDQGNLNVVASELTTSATGRNHFNWPFQYFPMLLVIVAPWSGFLPLAFYDAIRRWRIDPATRFVLIWFGAIFLSLCLNGNKQLHYLLMLTPPISILLGRSLLVWPIHARRLYGIVFAGTALTVALGAIGIPVVAIVVRGRFIPIDCMLAAIILIGVGTILWACRRKGAHAGTLALLASVVIFLPIVEGVWIPSLFDRSMRTVAKEIRQRFGDGPYVACGPHASLTLCFELRTEIPYAASAEELSKFYKTGVIVISQSRLQDAQRQLPGPFHHQQEVFLNDEVFDLYQFDEPASKPDVAREASLPR